MTSPFGSRCGWHLGSGMSSIPGQFHPTPVRLSVRAICTAGPTAQTCSPRRHRRSWPGRRGHGRRFVGECGMASLSFVPVAGFLRSASSPPRPCRGHVVGTDGLMAGSRLSCTRHRPRVLIRRCGHGVGAPVGRGDDSGSVRGAAAAASWPGRRRVPRWCSSWGRGTPRWCFCPRRSRRGFAGCVVAARGGGPSWCPRHHPKRPRQAIHPRRQ